MWVVYLVYIPGQLTVMEKQGKTTMMSSRKNESIKSALCQQILRGNVLISCVLEHFEQIGNPIE